MTSITLRKANAIQLAIKDLIKSIKIVSTVNINEFQDYLTVIKEAQELLQQENSRKLHLLNTLREIRKLVGNANATSGINEKLADVAGIDKIILHFEELINSPTPLLDLSVISGKLNKIKTQVEIKSWTEDTVLTGVMSLETLDFFKKEVRKLKKEKQTLNDEILALNITRTIRLGQSSTDILTTENLI